MSTTITTTPDLIAISASEYKEFVDNKVKLSEANNTIEKLKAQLEIQRGFLENYCATMEDFFYSDEDQLSIEHMEEYISCATYMKARFNRDDSKRIDAMTDNMRSRVLK
jgi:predicted solute-binding protein